MNLAANSQQDPKPFLKSLLASFDLSYFPSGPSAQPQFPNVEAYATQFGKQLKPACAIIFDGHPLIPQAPANDARLEFQKKWLGCPLTSHQMSSYDAHLIPGTGLYSVTVNGKVRFDEGGKSRLGESADLVQTPNGPAKPRPIWGSWYGFNMNMVIDEAVFQL
ncbi:uncharacterized protein CXQ87_001844 [Candidozyma duobushaemuli]|uniref:Uncharacterized protein n=1 Tax=Candidozyma duobushaemuli TaxID=1231522 RepID=A0A2V1A819_9ASCO|nr:uncharacterized protein CXQ87_001844 [[Candida] duobushaemulonis]PVH13726.1 hypothetical protein CXQ87_001844 [[Candida] duobushaemulonis]